jgi:hypothetical protein
VAKKRARVMKKAKFDFYVRSPLAPLEKGGTRLKVSLFKEGNRLKVPLFKEGNILKVSLFKEGNRLKVPLFKGDLGGSN